MSEIEHRLARLVERTTGNVIPEGQYPHLREVVSRRARAAGYADLERYLGLLEHGGLRQEWRKLLPDITIKESFLFRISEQFDALSRDLLPAIMAQRSRTDTLRVWSAGCARGEEPSTLAIVLLESPCLAGRPWEILATDVDEEALVEARRGEFGTRAVGRVPEPLLRRYFEAKGERYTLTSELLDRIEFRPFNFFTSPYSSLGAPFDLIFLRNVLIYFSPTSQRKVVSQIVQHLAGDGYLFLGHSESLWQLNETMEPVELNNCFAYRPVGEAEKATKSPRWPARMDPRPMPTKPIRRPSLAELKAGPKTQRAPTGSSRLETDLDPTEYIPRSVLEKLKDRPKGPPAPRPALTPARRGSLEAAARALAEDHFEEARELLEDSLPAHKGDAFAHALHGLIHDLAGEAQDAVAAYRAALFLDPELFQVRFLLAKRFEHLGWNARARNECRQVLTSLANGRSHDLTSHLPGLLPSHEEIGKRCRQLLKRS